MKNQQHNIPFILFIGFLLLVLIYSCKADKVKATDTDIVLFDMAKSTDGFSWYKNSETLLNKSSGSGHPQPFLRTRYNSIAALQLDMEGKIIAGTDFPEGSLIVKELYDDASTLGRYAILYKQANNPDADANGWVWGYINANGVVAASASEKGSSCISCHSQAENIDYMLMNKYFP